MIHSFKVWYALWTTATWSSVSKEPMTSNTLSHMIKSYIFTLVLFYWSCHQDLEGFFQEDEQDALHLKNNIPPHMPKRGQQAAPQGYFLFLCFFPNCTTVEWCLIQFASSLGSTKTTNHLNQLLFDWNWWMLLFVLSSEEDRWQFRAGRQMHHPPLRNRGCPGNSATRSKRWSSLPSQSLTAYHRESFHICLNKLCEQI